jgi:glycosyltransferase involved in cell wall biosynthesis
MKILIITHEFPPLNTIGAQRPYSWAKYWNRMGHDVKVITTQKEPIDGFLNKNFDYSQLSNVEIKEIEYLPDFLKAKKSFGQENDFLFTSSKSAKSDCIENLKRISKIIRASIGIGSLLSIRNLWIKPALKEVQELYQEWKFDCVVSTHGPPAPHIIAGITKRKLDIFWVADYRDLWSQTHYLGTKFPFSVLQKLIESFFISQADFLTTVSDPLNKKLNTQFGKHVFTIENGFDIEEVLSLEQKAFPKDAKIRLIYTGTIRRSQQNTEPFLKALYLLNQKRDGLQKELEVLFYGFQLGDVAKQIQKYSLCSFVKIPKALSHQEILTIQRSVNGLLFFDWEDISYEGILTGKIFEYMYAGVPILVLGKSSKTAAARLVCESGTGIFIGNSPENISQYIDNILNQEHIVYSPSKEVLSRYTREKLAKKMLQAIIEAQQKKSFS